MMEHAVTNKTATIPDENADFGELLRELHTSSDHLFARPLTTYDFEQAHDVCGTEEVSPNDRFGPRRGRGNLIDIERGGVARQNRAFSADLIQLREDLFLERHTFKNRLNHDIHFAEIVVAERGLNSFQALVDELLGEASAVDGVLIVLLNRGQAAVESRLVGIFEQHRNSGVGEYHGDPATHGSCADDGC